MANIVAGRSAVRVRVIIAFVVTVLLITYLIGRLAWIQIVRADELYEQAWEQWSHNVPVSTARGSIYDSRGRLLAGSTSAQTVAAIPPRVEDRRAVSAALAPVLNMNEEEIYELISLERSAVYIKRKVNPEVAEAVRDMNLPGIIFFSEEKRYYPGGNLASQLLGFAGTDQGLAGLEAYYENYLAGSEGIFLFPADARGRQVPHDFTRSVQPEQGYNLHLSIDETIQHIVERELERTMQESAPRQAMAVAVDPYSGAVLAAAARPDYNPDSYRDYDPERWKLAPFTSSFEPGSTFKMVTLAAVIEEGLFNPEESFSCSGHTTIEGRRINCWTSDRGGHGEINFFESLGASCNPAFIELGRRLGKEELTRYIEAFGYGEPTGVDYPGESSGLIFTPDNMGPLELATTAFGQGVSVSPIQQTVAVAAMINGGYLYKPYLVEEVRSIEGDTVFKQKPEMVRQVVSAETSAKLIEMMENVVLEGTGRAAAVEGYRAAGKTGTAEKLDPDKEYMKDEYIYSFVGFAPVENPRLVLYVAVDGVTKGPRLGVHTSAPLFSRIMEDTMKYLQVSPSQVLPDDAEQE